MKHPTIKQLDFVIDKLKSVLPQASKENAFNISASIVYCNGLLEAKYLCGTVHCTGGWYAFANLRRKVIKDKYDKGFIGYEDGADLMARDLGFKNREKLSQWARDNPYIWGNTDGYYIFLHLDAYDYLGFNGVVKQFELVRRNLMKLKEK